MKKYQIPIFIILSLSIHLSVLSILNSINLTWSPMQKALKKPNKFNIVNIRSVGERDGKKDTIFAQKRIRDKKKVKIKDLTFNPIQNEDIINFQKARPGRESLLRQKKLKTNSHLSITNSKIKSFLSNDPYSLPAAEQLAKMDQTNVLFDLEVPRGVAEDELNKHELVFYSFRKRTALAYVNSFQKQLNSFESKHPRLRFPLTSDPQTISGKLTYDKNGDILKIETLKYTQITKLQDFFMNVLQDMSSLPNPPKEIINNRDKFVINFILEVNGRI